MKTLVLKVCQENFFDNLTNVKIYKNKGLESYMTDIPNSLQEKQVTTPIGRFSTPDNIGTELSENEGRVVEYESDIEELNNLRSMLLENQNEGLNEGIAEDVISKLEPITKNVDEDVRIPSLEQFTDVHTKIPAIKITLEAIDRIFNKIKLKDRSLINSLRKNKNFFTTLNNNEIPKSIGLESFLDYKLKLSKEEISDPLETIIISELNKKAEKDITEFVPDRNKEYHFESSNNYCNPDKINKAREKTEEEIKLDDDDKIQLKTIVNLELLRYNLAKNNINLENYRKEIKQLVNICVEKCDRNLFNPKKVHNEFYEELNRLYKIK